MRRRRYLVLILVSIVLATGSCTALEHGSVRELAAGVTVDRIDGVRQPLTSLPELFPEVEGRQHVFEISGDPAGEAGLLIVGSHGAAWVDAEGKPVRRVAFEGGASHFPARSIPLGAGETGFLALRNEAFGAGRSEGELILYRADGRARTRFPAGYSSAFFAADLVGDAAPEVVVETALGRGMVVHALDGRSLQSYDAGAYVSALAPADVNRDGRAEVVLYLYPVDGRGAFQVVQAGGGLHSSWAAPPVGDFDVVPVRGGGPGFMTLVDDRLRIEAVGGEVVETLEAPEAGRFRTVESLSLPDGRRVTLASGAGDLDAHMILIHGAPETETPGGEPRLLYRRVDRGRAGALHVVPADTAPAAVYFGVGDTVWTLRSGS